MLLNDIYKATLNQTSLLDLKGKKILLAVSGGIDSIFLYHIFREMSNKYDFVISLVHINYNSHDNSNDAMRLCLKLTKKYKKIFYLRHSKLLFRSNIEARAREYRYNVFNNIKKIENYDYIATAHHKNDLIETLYMQNKNKNDISIIPFSNSLNKVIRPILGVEKETIKKYMKLNNYKYVEDSTNLDTKFKRNYIRKEVIPNHKNIELLIDELIEIYNIKKYKMELFKKSKKMYESDISFDELLNKIKIKKSIFSSIDVYMMKLIFQGLVGKHMEIKIKKTQKYWNSLYQKIISNKNNFFEDFGEGLKIFSTDKYVYIFKENNFIRAKKLKNGSAWLNGKFRVLKNTPKKNQNNNKNIFICPQNIYRKGLTIRKWIYGDRFDLNNGGRKKVSDLFNENKLNSLSKNEFPIVLNNDRIEWIPGLAYSRNNYKNNDKIRLIEWVIDV